MEMGKMSGKNLLTTGKARGEGDPEGKGQSGMIMACGPGARLCGFRSQLPHLAATQPWQLT